MSIPGIETAREIPQFRAMSEILCEVCDFTYEIALATLTGFEPVLPP